jgi:hypothetical protein
VIELIPLSLTRMFYHPCIERAAFLRLRLIGHNLDLAAVDIDLEAGYPQPSRNGGL